MSSPSDFRWYTLQTLSNNESKAKRLLEKAIKDEEMGDYVAEILWPGAVDIATRVGSVGRSSVRLEQALFQDGRLVATAASVVVHFDLAARKSRPLPGPSVAALEALRRPAARA